MLTIVVSSCIHNQHMTNSLHVTKVFEPQPLQIDFFVATAHDNQNNHIKEKTQYGWTTFDPCINLGENDSKQ